MKRAYNLEGTDRFFRLGKNIKETVLIWQALNGSFPPSRHKGARGYTLERLRHPIRSLSGLAKHKILGMRAHFYVHAFHGAV
jgi:hypothetical protein